MLGNGSRVAAPDGNAQRRGKCSPNELRSICRAKLVKAGISDKKKLAPVCLRCQSSQHDHPARARRSVREVWQKLDNCKMQQAATTTEARIWMRSASKIWTLSYRPG